MTDREKLEKLVAYLMRRMYAHNQMADIGSTGEVFDEKIENAKYEECRDTLNFIDSMQEEPKFKIGQTITDPEDSTFTFHINKIEDGKYIESDDAWVLIKDADEEYELVEEPVSKDRFAFKAIPRLLEMLKPNDRAKAYTNRLADALEKEGYNTDAKIVREKIRVMNGETVAMATMDEEPVSEDLLDEIHNRWEDDPHTKWPKCPYKDFKNIACHFANWQKQQMMKDAIEAEVTHGKHLAVRLDA